MQQERPRPRRAAEHYDAAYFAYQATNAELRGRANAFKFAAYLEPGDRIVDFGCGDGGLLATLGGRTGVEINPVAVERARARGLTVVNDIAELPDASADVIVSNHALEHVENPVAIVREMHRVLRPGGRVVLVVPCDRAHVPFDPEDINFHLFSWSAATLGNLVRLAGFEVREAGEIVHAWPPGWARIQRAFGWRAFHLAARAWGRLRRATSQVRVVGERPREG